MSDSCDPRDCSLPGSSVHRISHASKIMLKILYGRFQQYIDQGLSYVQAGFRQGRRTRDQITKNPWTRGFKEHICFIDYTKAFDCVDHNKLWKILKEMGIPDHLTYLLRNLYANQEATIRTGHGTIDWFQNWEMIISRLYIVTLFI